MDTNSAARRTITQPDLVVRSADQYTHVNELPSHHRRDGFHNPWSRDSKRGVREVVKMLFDTPRRPDPMLPGGLPSAAPSFAHPRAAESELSVTWVGHSTMLIQIGGTNVLTDPVWSERASPVSFAGPRRYMPPGIAFESLPPIDIVVLSHDHYDHADTATVRALARRYPNIEWYVPLGLGPFLQRFGAQRVGELDWWGSHTTDTRTITCVPAKHFSGRGLRRNRSLWSGWVIRAGERAVHFVGDTGWFPGFRDIRERTGPFDLVLMPIGAYDPRWFMGSVHIDPEEAVRAFMELRDESGTRRTCMVATHWGTFKLTFEPLNEPPERVRDAWLREELPSQDLWILAHGETRWFP